MIPRFSALAIQNLTSIRDYIAKDSPETAARVVGDIIQSIRQLEKFPLSGRIGKLSGTRELVIPNLPYILAYRIVSDAVVIAAIVHTSRKWPKKL